ncbi:MAG TPA: chemotaxis protein CheB [Gemmatimonadaceae bacterium]|jgi:two-component system chemotaxis response regulator CheB|nr:chemotaxis protein CheB [Gemmatimonadaceae bacterium]
MHHRREAHLLLMTPPGLKSVAGSPSLTGGLLKTRDIIVIGASAGGVEALQRLVSGLPADLPAAVFVTVHFPPSGTSVLPRILSRVAHLTVLPASDGERIIHGRVYVAPPDHHLLLSPRGVRIVHGPKEHGHRPAIDAMFRSAAIAFGPRVIGVILTGNLDDGTSGLRAIKRAGGAAVVQDPGDANFPSMPQSAIENVEIDRVVPIKAMATTILGLIGEPISEFEHFPMTEDVSENNFANASEDAIDDADHHPGEPSTYGCPDCGGVLWRIKDGQLTHFRCRIGHAWSEAALLDRQTNVVDDALWTALRALEESASLSKQIANRYRARGADGLAERFDAQARQIDSRARVILDSLTQRQEARASADDDSSEPKQRAS